VSTYGSGDEVWNVLDDRTRRAILECLAERPLAAQVALAWILAKNPTHVPIPGTTKLHRLEENIAAAALTLPADQVAQLDQAAADIPIIGERYSPPMQQMIDR
jgi:aryl-alcohol dehydrogenase-like predicted oxidoreductase